MCPYYCSDRGSLHIGVGALTHTTDTLVQSGARSGLLPDRRPIQAALIVAAAYYLGAKLGFALTLRPSPVSTLWPPNSLLLAGFLLTPVQWWGWMLLAVFPAHLLVQLPTGFPLHLILGWYVSNCSEALIGAGIVRRLIKGPLRFDRSRDVGVFIVGAVFLGTILSTFLDAGFVSLSGESAFWEVWQTRLLSNMLTSLTLVPFIVTWACEGFADLRLAHPIRYLEAWLLGATLLPIVILVFNDQTTGLHTSAALLYAPLPLVLWAAIRFGSRGASTALVIVTAFAIWGAVHGRGPFLTSSPAENAVSIQLFLIVFAVPLLVLAAVIQERRHAEDLARASEERLSLALEAAQVGTWGWDIVTNQSSWSAKSKEILGLEHTSPEAPLREFLDAITPEDRGRVQQAIQDALERGTQYDCEFRVARRGSETRWVQGKGKAIYNGSGQPVGMIGVNLDITERKSAEKFREDEATLRVSESRFRELADAMPQIVWSAGPDGHIDYFNNRWYELTAAQDSGEQNWIWMTHPEDRNITLDAWRTAVLLGERCEVEHRLRVGETGEYRWHLARAVPVRNQVGKIVRWYGSCTDIEDQKQVEGALRESRLRLEDRVTERTAELSAAVVALQTEITERAAAERALRSSEERFGTAFHSSPDAIVILRQSDYRFLEVNEKWEAMFGYTPAEAVGRTAGELGLVVNEEERRQVRAQLEAQGFIRELELETRSKSGDALRVVMVAHTVEMGGEPCYIMILRDITERKRSESMLQQQQRELAHLSRVASLGELSGALAHELNQPLAAILANVRAAQRMISVDAPNLAELREVLEDIALDDRRAGEVIFRLRGLLKKSDVQPRPVRIEEIVSEVLALLHSDLIQRRVSVQTDLEPNLPPAMGDRVQLQQVLLNLMLNACEAMADRPPSERRITIAAARSEAGVRLSVSDHGSGIPAGRLEQIFEPFVTTKDHGLGLGLAICRSIVSAHGGRMWVLNNSSDPGATFFVELNQSSAESQPTQA